MDPDHQSLDPDPELESPDIPKRVEIRLRCRIQGRNRNTSSHETVNEGPTAMDSAQVEATLSSPSLHIKRN